MPSPGRPGERTRRRKSGQLIRRLFVLSVFGFFGLFPWLSGCAGDNQRMANDPLMGAPASRPGTTTPLGSTASIARPAPTAPAAPVPSSLTSNAALASGSPRSLDSSNDLRIGGDPPRSPNSRYSQEPPIGAVLNPPQPMSGASIPNTTLAFGPATRPAAQPSETPHYAASGSRINTYEQAQSYLAAHGVTWQRLETWGDKGEWKFTCSVPNKQNQYISRNFEAKAPDYLAAMQAVIEQMEKER